VIRGIGTDLVEIARIEQSLSRWGEKFAQRILDTDELEEFRSARRQANFLAKRFAAKEAAVKALGTGMRQGVHFRQIKVAHNESGAPILLLTGRASAIAITNGVSKHHLSITDEKDYAVAFVVLTG
jgi:holo-[acyl-carrier protein] synthase